MPRGVKRPKRVLVIRGRGSWKQKPPLEFDMTPGYLWVGRQREDGEPEYVFSLSPADARRLAEFIQDAGAGERRD